MSETSVERHFGLSCTMYLENYILRNIKSDSIERKNLNKTSEVIILKIEISQE